jgi:glycogen synthase
VVVTNDWFTGLVPAYARCGHFGRWFDGTDILHICHNLDPSYEGRMYPGPKGTLEHIHGLPVDRLVDPTWTGTVINPTRCALLASDTWATVSRSYRQDLLSSSPLNHILCSSPHPFAHPNGIDIGSRTALLDSLGPKFGIGNHAQAKEYLQSKYFGAGADATRPLFGFVGRVTAQKGVHLILSSVEPIIHATGGRAQFIIGGMASLSDTYGQGCASEMYRLHKTFPGNFWADPTAFFTDGVAVNLGCDFCLMPSMFEPGGIVQHEFFVAGTPVVAFKTGGLKDSVIEYSPRTPGRAVDRRGNGFTFERYDLGDFLSSMHRALAVFDSAQEYEQCRSNALRSVMPLSTVSTAWFGEFCRLRRALPVPNPTRVAADQEARQAASDSLRDAGVNPFVGSIRVNASGFEIDGGRAIAAGAAPAASAAALSTAAAPAAIPVAAPPPAPSPVTPSLSGRAELSLPVAAGSTDAPPDRVRVLFVVKAPGVAGSQVCPEVGATVSVCGSWDGWSARTLLSPGGVATPGKIAAVVNLAPGDYAYKYVVTVPKTGEQWRVDASAASSTEGGVTNNRLSVVIGLRLVSKTEEEATAEIEQALLGGVGARMQALLWSR